METRKLFTQLMEENGLLSMKCHSIVTIMMTSTLVVMTVKKLPSILNVTSKDLFSKSLMKKVA